MKITNTQLKQIIREELTSVLNEKKSATVNEIFGMGKPQYQQDIADEDEAKKKGYRSARSMQWSQSDWESISKCSAFTDGFKYFAEKMGAKHSLNLGWFGGLKAPKDKEQSDRYQQIMDHIKTDFAGPSEKWFAEIKSQCPNLGK